MREAIGGTMLMYIVVFFLFIYIVFMAVVINYGRVFRTKNGLISYIEAEEGFKDGFKNNLIAKANELGYRSGDIYACYTQGNNEDTRYFSVKLNIEFQMPLVDGSIKIPITGETSAIRNVKDNIVEIGKCGDGDKKFDGNQIR